MTNEDPRLPQEVPSAPEVIEQAGMNVELARQYVFKSFLGELDGATVVPFDPGKYKRRKGVRLFQLDRLVCENRQDILDRSMSVYTALGAIGVAAVLILESDGKTNTMFLGVRAGQDSEGGAAAKVMEAAMAGQFPGSELIPLEGEDVRRKLNKLGGDENKQAMAALTGIPAMKTEERDHFVQGLDQFLDAMQGKSFHAVLLAEPIDPVELYQIRSGYETLATQVAPLAKSQVSYGLQDSQSVQESVSRGLTEGITESIALSEGKTHSETHSTTHTKTHTKTHGTTGSSTKNLNLSLIFISGGGSRSRSKSESTSDGISVGTSDGTSESETHTRTQTSGTTKSHSEQHTDGTTKTLGTQNTISIECPNKSISELLKKIDKHLERIENACAYGAWQAAAYFFADTTREAQAAAALFHGTLRGEGSGAEDFAITTWTKNAGTNRTNATKWLSYLRHPRLELAGPMEQNWPTTTPATLLSGKEVSLLLGLPRKSAGGVTVLEAPAYGRQIRTLEIEQREKDRRTVLLGTLRHLWRDDFGTPIELAVDQLTAHTLVTGTTGVGKTTAIQALLTRLKSQDIPFLVIEPAKGEYKCLCSKNNEVGFYVAGVYGTHALRMNPLVFPQGIELADHVDRVCAILNAAFPMYAAMPQVLEAALFLAYEQRGWDPISSTCIGKRRFPTLAHVATLVPEVVKQLGYSEQLTGDYIGALTARLQSFCRGTLGLTTAVDAEDETSAEALFERSCVADLSRVGMPEKKALLMGMLMMRLYEHRIVKGIPADNKLRHIAVLEEAHNLLKRTSTDQNQESSNARGQAVEAFSNALAEMRAYGQAFLMADQSATALDLSVLRNTNTKIVFRTPFEEDRETLGGALNLDERQRNMLARLENYTAVVSQGDWLEAVLCRIEKVDLPEAREVGAQPQPDENIRQMRTAAVKALMRGRFPDGISLPDTEVSDSEIFEWLKESEFEEDACETVMDLMKKRGEGGETTIEDISGLLTILLAASSLIRFAEQSLVSPQGILNSLVAHVMQQTLFSEQALVDEIVHVLLREIGSDTAERLDDFLIEKAEGKLC